MGTQFLCEKTQMFCKIMQSFSEEHHTFAREIQSVSGGTQYFCERDFARELKNISCPLRASVPDQPYIRFCFF